MRARIKRVCVVLARAPSCPCAFRGFAPLRCFVRGLRCRGLDCIYSASRADAPRTARGVKVAAPPLLDVRSCPAMLGDPNRVSSPAPGRDDAPASHEALGQEAGGRSGCTRSPSSKQSSRESRPVAVRGRRPSSPRTHCPPLTLAAWAALRTAPATLRPPPALAPDQSRSPARAWSSTRSRTLAGEMDYSSL